MSFAFDSAVADAETNKANGKTQMETAKGGDGKADTTTKADAKDKVPSSAAEARKLMIAGYNSSAA